MTPSVTPRSSAAGLRNDSGAADRVAAHALCVAKIRRSIERLAAHPRSAAWAADGNYFAHAEGFFEISNWTSSFFTGMAVLAYEATRDISFVRQLSRLADPYREKVTRHRMDTMHDLGFLYSLYSVAMQRLTGDPGHRRTGLLAADELAKRFRAQGGYIQAWGRMDEPRSEYAGLAIIDCMMNLPLLFWASQETGIPFYREIAVRHAETSLDLFLRPDDTVYHALRFNLETGDPMGPENYCGHEVESHWARGTAWAIYGFALAYRHTHDTRYLEAAIRIGRRFHSLLDEERVPVWDFRLPPGQPPLRDSSAAAIAVCGLDEVNAHRADPGLAACAESLLDRLCRSDYLDQDPGCPGVLRNAEVGDGRIDGTSAVKAKNVYASWGDYFFMEALSRRLHPGATHW